MEGRFWLGLILTFALTAVLAFFTENEQIFLKELEFAVESTAKGADFLAEQVNQKFPHFDPRDLKRIFALMLRESPSIVGEEDFAATFKLLLEERDKVDGILLQDQHWRVAELKPLPSRGKANSERRSTLPGVGEYVDLMLSSSLSTAANVKLHQILETSTKWNTQDLQSYKQIILAWFDKQLSLQENTIQRHGYLAVSRINGLKDALKHGKVTDERLKSAIKRKIENLESILLDSSDKFRATFDELITKSKMSKPKENVSHEQPKIDEQKSSEPATADELNHHNFEKFKQIFSEIEILEFQ